MDVAKRIDLRLTLFVGAVKAGKLPGRWDDEERPSLVGDFGYMRAWLSGHIAATLKLLPPNRAVINEHTGQSPGKAWAEAESAGTSGKADGVIEAIMGEFDFAQPNDRSRVKGTLATIRSHAAVALRRGQEIPLRRFSALAKANFTRNHSAWLDHLDAANNHSSRKHRSVRGGPGDRATAAKEPYRVGSLGFKTWRGVVRPRLDLLACPLDRLLAPLYSAALKEIDGRLLVQDRWVDIADLIKLFRNPRPYFASPGTKGEFSDLTGEHVRLAVQRALRFKGIPGT